MTLGMAPRLRPLLVLLACAACSNESKPDPAEGGGACPVLRPRQGELDLGCTAPDGGSIAVPTLSMPCATSGPSSSAPPRDLTALRAAPVLELDDFECKYHVSLQYQCSASARKIEFLASVTTRVGDESARTAAPYVDAILGATHPAPNFTNDYSELGAGQYWFGPVEFDRPGAWSLELHLYGRCSNGPTSPHGHVYLEADVP